MRTEELKMQWEKIVAKFTTQFTPGDEMDLDGILFLIGVQETGKGFKRYKKDEKIDVIHVAICKLLTPYGYYKYEGVDEEGWPHYKATGKLPALKPGEQTLLMKEAIVGYALNEGWLT